MGTENLPRRMLANQLTAADRAALDALVDVVSYANGILAAAANGQPPHPNAGVTLVHRAGEAARHIATWAALRDASGLIEGGK